MTTPSNLPSPPPLIVPPREVRQILDTTASFVGTKPAVEAKILQRHSNDPSFSFLRPEDPYHAYYRHRVAHHREQHANPAVQTAKETEKPAEGIPEAGTESGGDQVIAEQPTQQREDNTTNRSAVVSILKSARVKNEASRKEPTHPPPDDIFTISHTTPTPTPLALDVIKLSAEFVAIHGEQFLATLSRKESRNSLFDFLKPLHPHFIIFQRLVDAYKLLISDDKSEVMQRIKGLTDRKVVMDAVWYLHDWECLQAEREHDAAMDESERMKAAMIDWHDFVIVETVVFNDNDQLPAPIADTQQLPRILAAAQKAEHERIKNASDVDMEIDEPSKDPRVVVDTVADIPSNLIRPAPLPRQQQQRQQQQQETTIVLPSGQKVPLSKVQESVKAELINPAYKDERARAAEKNRLQNLAGGEEMARNLARLDAKRKDGVVYNRADLQDAMPKRGNVDEEVTRRLGKAVKSGPELPDDERVTKKARIEKAVEELSKKKEIDTVAEYDEVDGNADGAGQTNKNGLLPEEAWLAKQGNSALVRIRLPSHPNTEWTLQGQEIEMKAPLKRNVAKLKGVITKLVKIPVNKQKLWVEGPGFMKDKMSLASYNVGDGCIIKLEVKERGGRKRGGG